ncbi:Proteinaceous RNase P 1, chloroplastic/mitochondrial [Vitis vinifera]|uniref:Proteinaceous RNase P 1, chloroplastic/mitochondrial n=1 Tax=Vitis vinifera TaxID=29760 RepID=A0A438H1I9_VITVI|nr:Proteinaceous RNase P 1, chloroplastic/mitochondrial [Vitis vinifera]
MRIEHMRSMPTWWNPVWLLKNLSSVLCLGLVWSRGGVDQVYEMMHRLRASVRQVSESTAEVVERWFNSEDAAGVGEENWDVGKVREGVVKGGGGWHGQGWLGKGKWKVGRTEMDEAGVCQSCGEKLVGIDIDPRETENFASSLTKLACQREVKADFVQFQVWHQLSASPKFLRFMEN